MLNNLLHIFEFISVATIKWFCLHILSHVGNGSNVFDWAMHELYGTNVVLVRVRPTQISLSFDYSSYRRSSTLHKKVLECNYSSLHIYIDNGAV